MRYFKSRRTSLTKITLKHLLVLILGTLWLSSCRSHVMPCPSFSQTNTGEEFQLADAPAMKLDKNGRVKK